MPSDLDPEAQELFSKPLNAEDEAVVASGEVTAEMAKALRNRRDQNFANDIEGPVHSGRLDKKIIFAYAPPSLTTVPLTLLISVYVIQFYESVGASLGLLAFFQALARAFDVVTDPTMSFISDSYRSKHGRRRPFMATGAPFYCICLVCLLWPDPSLDSVAVSIWFGFFYIAFFLMATYCNIPYDALAPELTDNQDDRSLVFFTCTLFDGMGALLAAMLPVGVGTVMTSWRSSNSNRYTSCNEPFEGTINPLSAVGPWPTSPTGFSTAPPSVATWYANISRTAVQIAAEYTTGSCTSFSFTQASVDCLSDLECWCVCRNKADVIHNLDSLRYSYFTTGIVFGLWALISLWTCVYMVKERMMMPGATEMLKPKPLVASVLNTFSNRPFTLLLPAWVLDSLADAIIGSLLTFFVRYVVQPEFSNPEWGCSPNGDLETMDWKCKSSTVLGASVLMLLFGAFAFTPMWLLISKKFGKRNTWLLYSFMNGSTFLCFSVVGKGDVILCIVMSVFNGAPIGGKFLSDTIMGDVIDYDEFLTGSRSEATYTMFKGFLPKIAAIPASAVPIVLLSTFGHVPPVDGILQPQPQSVINFIKIVIIYIPSMLAFSSFFVKMRFPLRSERQYRLITEGVANHLIGRGGQDPCSDEMYEPVEFDADELDEVNLLDSFRGVQVIERMIANQDEEKQSILKRAKIQVVLALAWIAFFLTIVISTFYLLLSKNDSDVQLQVIPVLSVVGVGTGITAFLATFLRLKTAQVLVSKHIEDRTLQKSLKQRRLLAKVVDFPATIRDGCTTKDPPERKPIAQPSSSAFMAESSNDVGGAGDVQLDEKPKPGLEKEKSVPF